MATSFKSFDTNIIILRQIFVRTANNGFIPDRHILISDGVGNAYWDSVSSISPIGYNEIIDAAGTSMLASSSSNVLRISSIGIGGLLDVAVASYTDPFGNAVPYLSLNNQAPNVLVAGSTVPNVSLAAAQIMPNPENLVFSTTQSTFKMLGVGDLQLSTVTSERAVFFQISSFTAAGYADLSAEARAWRPYVYSTNSTSAGYATFTSSIPISTSVGGWDWTPFLTSNVPMSTTEAYPNYTTGDLYFSTCTFNMPHFQRYIHPNSTTKMFLEVTPNYLFPRMFLGTSTPYTLIKEFSSFIQYESPGGGVQILPSSVHGGMLLSQQSNVYTSNYFNTPLKLELDTATVMSNYLADGAAGYYTLFHRIPAAMAGLTLDDCGCDYKIDGRGGFSNPAITYTNFTSRQNAVYLTVFNQQGAAPPMPGP